MPIKTKKVTHEFDAEEMKAALIESLGDEVPEGATVEVYFDIGTQYDALDRGPGTPVLRGAKVSVTTK